MTGTTRPSGLSVTHDRNTMTAHAQDRLNQGLHMTGLIVIEQFINIGKAIQEVGTLAQAGDPGAGARHRSADMASKAQSTLHDRHKGERP